MSPKFPMSQPLLIFKSHHELENSKSWVTMPRMVKIPDIYEQ